MVGYPWHVVATSLTIDWSTQGDEWLYRFSRALAETSVSVTGHLYDATTEPFLRITLQGGNDGGAVILLAFTTDSVFVILAGESEADENFIGVVTSAAEHAAATLGDEGEEIPWTALIGPGPERIGGGMSRLTAEVSIGSMKLASTDQVLVEPDLTQQRSLSSWGIHHSIPIRVSGSSRGYNWIAASARATRDLHTLCGLLSAVTDETIVVREVPAPTTWGERLVPDRLPWYRPSSVDTDSFDLSTATALTLPEKLGSAWSRVQDEPALIAALDTYLEGVQVASRHPSLAAVSFVASVETVAGKLFKFERCKDCKNRLGLGAAFKASLRKVVSEEEAASLDSVYSARSKTVHAGRLHGGETTPGLLFRGPWSQDSASDFRWQTLWRLRSATRLLLVWSIENPWPARTPITPG